MLCSQQNAIYPAAQMVRPLPHGSSDLPALHKPGLSNPFIMLLLMYYCKHLGQI